MTTQLTFSEQAPYAKGSATSRSAAESIEPQLSRLEQIVFSYIAGQGRNGATCDEVELGCKLSHQTSSARIRGLAKKSRIMDSTARRWTRARRPAVVWVLYTQQELVLKRST